MSEHHHPIRIFLYANYKMAPLTSKPVSIKRFLDDVVLTLTCSLYSAQIGRQVDVKGRKKVRSLENRSLASRR